MILGSCYFFHNTAQDVGTLPETYNLFHGLELLVDIY